MSQPNQHADTYPGDLYYRAYQGMIDDELLDAVCHVAACSPRTLLDARWGRSRVSEQLARRITGALLHYSLVPDDTEIGDLFPRHAGIQVLFVKADRSTSTKPAGDSLAALYIQWLKAGWVGRQTIVDLARNAANDKTRRECARALDNMGIA